jgi:NitT/TauT family transport system permease protein
VSDLFELRTPLPRRLRLPLALAAPLLVLGAWCVLSYGHLVSDAFLPSPTEVVRGLLQLFIEKQLGFAILKSTERIAFAFLLAAAVALPLGIAMGAFEPINAFFEPVMAPLRFMPISAFIPLLIVWFGIEESEKIAFLFLGVFVYLLPVAVNAVRAVPQEYVDTAYTLGASRFQVIRSVLVPAALPEIFESFRVMNAIAWTYVILAEAVNPGVSLGYLIQLAYSHSKPEWSFAGLLVIGGVGLASDAILRALSAALFRWREVE